MTLLLSFRIVCACWFFCLRDRGTAEQNTSVCGGVSVLLFAPRFGYSLVFLSLLILSYFVTMEAWGNTGVLQDCCHTLYYFTMLFCYEENKMEVSLCCIACSFTCRAELLCLHHNYISYRVGFFHVDVVSRFFFIHSLFLSCFKTQIILSTNIAESSVTVPDVKYGKSSKFWNCVRIVFVVSSFLVLA